MNDDEMFKNVFGDGDKGMGGMPSGLSTMLLALSSAGMPQGNLITGEEVEFHDEPKITLPRGMTYGRAFEILKRLERDSETETRWDQSFRYRPDDGAYATMQVIKARYGMVLGETVQTMFGTRPAEKRTIAVGVNETIQVPWGLISIPALKGLTLELCDMHPDPDYGRVFELHVEGPKKYQDEVKAIFNDIEAYLKTNSIYRGKALTGADRLEFLDLSSFKADEVVFSDEVMKVLNVIVWGPLRLAESYRKDGISLKRAALLYGPYGTGKTSAGMMTAQMAVANGWTFISAKPGRDSTQEVLQTARLYQPCVVFWEDVDGEASNGEPDEASQLLDNFDGITAKGGEIVFLATTNFIDRVQKGMLRPGRLDAIVEVAGLDRNGVERLVRAIVPNHKLDPGIDFDAIYASMDGFLPSFVRETITRAKSFAIYRLDGSTDYVLTTADFVDAADSLQSQLALLNNASEGDRRPTLDTAISDAVKAAAQQAVHGTELRGTSYTLSVPELNGAAH